MPPSWYEMTYTNEDSKRAELFIVRLWDGMDGAWHDASKPVSKQEAEKIWNEKTNNGKTNISFQGIDWYEIFPANTVMRYNPENEFFRGGK